MEDINIQKFTNVIGDNLIVIPDTTEASNGDVLTYDSELNVISWKPPQGGGGGSTGDYVPLSAINVAVGTNNTAEYGAFAQGINNNAQKNGVAIGAANTADTNSFTQGEYCVGNTRGLAQGSSAKAYTNSFSQGESTYASNGSLAQGLGVSATQYSIAQGNNVSATNNAQAFGEGIRISAGMAIGKYNDTTSGALFVIGNGTSNAARSDAFIVYPTGQVSGSDFTTNGVSLSGMLLLYNALTARPLTGSYSLKCVDGVLTWEGEVPANAVSVNNEPVTVNNETFGIGD